MEIQVVDNNVEKAIRVLKRKLQQEGLFREMKQRKYYEKPSVKRKRKEKEAMMKAMEAEGRLTNGVETGRGRASSSLNQGGGGGKAAQFSPSPRYSLKCS